MQNNPPPLEKDPAVVTTYSAPKRVLARNLRRGDIAARKDTPTRRRVVRQDALDDGEYAWILFAGASDVSLYHDDDEFIVFGIDQRRADER